MKFDVCLMNPPYTRTLHLDILRECLNFCNIINIIEPATWLINVRKNGKAKLYDEIKTKLIKGHVSKVVVENYNIEFRTGLYVPFAVTYIDFTKDYDEIEFYCFGEKRIVKSLYDCNYIGNYDMIWNIFNKVQSYGDMMKDHITNKEIDGMYYLPYMEIITAHGYESNVDYVSVSNGEYYGTYTTPAIHKSKNVPQEHIGVTRSKNKNQEPVTCDTKEHLENWKYFVFNNKLPLFLNMCLTIDQNNNSKEFLPWLVDKQYTDGEINKMFNFTDEEIALIDKTIKKFERHSPWFKRYMCGKDSVPAEEVQKFIDK